MATIAQSGQKGTIAMEKQPYLPYLEPPTKPPPPLLLPSRAESLEDVPHPEIPYLDGAGWEVGEFIGSGIDKSAYFLIDGQGEPRADVVLKVARHSDSCDDNQQCQNEISMWSWLVKVQHPLRSMFAAVEAIVTNIEVEDGGETKVRTCYLSEFAKKIGGYNQDTEMERVKVTLSSVFGIYDLHGNNVGVTEDGRSVVLDYGLFAGFEQVQEQWEAAVAADPNASPEEILESLSPMNTPEEHDRENFCDECNTYVSDEHCHCDECNRYRLGGDACYSCNTITTESSRLSETCTTHVRCNTCLELARQQRHPSQCHPRGDTGWRMHPSCECNECRDARACFRLALGRRLHTYPEAQWCYRNQCPCQWCKRARSEHARLGGTFRKLSSPQSLPKLSIGSTLSTLSTLPNLHPNSDRMWRMYDSCDCDNCIAARKAR